MEKLSQTVYFINEINKYDKYIEMPEDREFNKIIKIAEDLNSAIKNLLSTIKTVEETRQMKFMNKIHEKTFQEVETNNKIRKEEIKQEFNMKTEEIFEKNRIMSIEEIDMEMRRTLKEDKKIEKITQILEDKIKCEEDIVKKRPPTKKFDKHFKDMYRMLENMNDMKCLGQFNVRCMKALSAKFKSMKVVTAKESLQRKQRKEQQTNEIGKILDAIRNIMHIKARGTTIIKNYLEILHVRFYKELDRCQPSEENKSQERNKENISQHRTTTGTEAVTTVITATTATKAITTAIKATTTTTTETMTIKEELDEFENNIHEMTRCVRKLIELNEK